MGVCLGGSFGVSSGFEPCIPIAVLPVCKLTFTPTTIPRKEITDSFTRTQDHQGELSWWWVSKTRMFQTQGRQKVYQQLIDTGIAYLRGMSLRSTCRSCGDEGDRYDPALA